MVYRESLVISTNVWRLYYKKYKKLLFNMVFNIWHLTLAIFPGIFWWWIKKTTWRVVHCGFGSWVFSFLWTYPSAWGGGGGWGGKFLLLYSLLWYQIVSLFTFRFSCELSSSPLPRPPPLTCFVILLKRTAHQTFSYTQHRFLATW